LLFVWKAVHREQCEEESYTLPLVTLQGHMFIPFLFILQKWLEPSKALHTLGVILVQGPLGATPSVAVIHNHIIPPCPTQDSCATRKSWRFNGRTWCKTQLDG